MRWPENGLIAALGLGFILFWRDIGSMAYALQPFKGNERHFQIAYLVAGILMVLLGVLSLAGMMG